MDDAAEDVTAGDPAARDRGRRAREWLSELKTSVRLGLVVVADVLVEDGFEVSSEDDKQMVEALRAGGARGALCERIRLRRADRGLTVSTPIEANTASKLVVNLVSRVGDQEPTAPSRLFEVANEVADAARSGDDPR